MLAIVFVLFGFATVYIPQPHINNVEVAHAGPAFDPIDFPFDINNAIQTTINTIKSSWIWLKENVLDGIAWVIAKQLISNMVASIVDWINSGFQGSPAFVQDLDGFLLQAADEAVGGYINSLGGLGSFVCAPFRLDVQLAVALQYDLDRENLRPQCTLTSVINNFDQFIDGDFSQGGWAGWFDLTSNPQHTPYGSIIAAQTDARAVIVNAEGEQLNLLDFGNGFLSGEMCTGAAGPDGRQTDCFITKPGTMIANQLNKSLGAGQDQLVQADEFNEIITALIGQLAQTAISGARGLLGLSGGTGVTYSGYSRGSFVADLADGVVNDTGSGGSSQGASGANTGSNGSNAGLDFINDSLTTQQNILNSVNGYINNLQNFINNPYNDPVDVQMARGAISEATTIRSRISADIMTATPILNQYIALENQYATSSAARRTAIRLEQTTLIQQFSTLALMTSAEYGVYTSRWDTLLAQNVPSPWTTTFPNGPSNCDPTTQVCN